jgi:type III pantothenate kinase
MHTLAVDIGNSNIVVALYRGDHQLQLFRYSSLEVQPETFYSHGLQELLLEWRVHPTDIQRVAISSVVPPLTDVLASGAESIFGFAPLVMGPELYARLPFRVPKPYEIGSDIVANAIAVYHKYERDCIVVDFGTALTFSIVSYPAGIEGVTIAPGINTAIKALAGNTAQLPEADISLPDSVIGKDTQHAIQAGVLHGYVGLTTHLIKAIQAELSSTHHVIATGGMANLLPLSPTVDTIDKSLTLDGIRLACKYA